MKKLLFAFLLLIHATFVHGESRLLPPPPAPDIAARSWVLLDFQSGQVLTAHNPDMRIEPASLTKLMTAYLSFTAIRQGRLKLDQTLPVSEKAWRTEGSRMFLDPRTPARVDDLLKGMIVQSGNDACITLAEGIAGTEEAFAELMNREAKRLGLSNTHFMNSTGLPHPQHYSTARDLALLAAALIRDFPEFYPLYALKEFTYNRITQPNRNRLLWQDPYVDGVKTGHTEAAGYCLIASARRGQMRLISVVTGAASDNARTAESQKLLNYGFQFYETYRLYQKGQTVATLPVYKGASNTVKAGFDRDVYLSLPKGWYAQAKASLMSRQPLLAPLTQGQAVGTLTIQIEGKPYASYTLQALTEVPVAGMFGRAWDTVKLWFK
ncbi:D-alanyl-D-alanine carboxypeptidase family protein [Thiobacter aerophilum]|uniref:serine-type D-Ala-D-Ala carboxypeptidase n=1 Tax=Thiobacter aerophilum TaxID=3121275 RepID=A0ABV0ED97_9BURK